MRTTPINDKEKVTSIQPLQERRDTKNLIQTEKFRCQDTPSPPPPPPSHETQSGGTDKASFQTKQLCPPVQEAWSRAHKPPSSKDSSPDFMPVPPIGYAGQSKALHLHCSPPCHPRRYPKCDCHVHPHKGTDRKKEPHRSMGTDIHRWISDASCVKWRSRSFNPLPRWTRWPSRLESTSLV